MRKGFLFLIFMMAVMVTDVAADNSEGDSLRLRWELETGGALGHTLFRDMGASPLSYRGPAVAPSLSLYRYQDNMKDKLSNSRGWITLDGILGIYADAAHRAVPFNTDAASLRLYVEMGHDRLLAPWIHESVCHRSWECLHTLSPLWGVSVDDHLLVTTIPTLENSSTALSNMLYVGLRGGLIYDIQKMKHHRSAHWQMEATATVSPIGYAFRPGFSYMDNFNASNGNIIFNNFTSTYSSDWVALPVAATALSASYTMASGNTLRLCYQWNYLTTRNSGAWTLNEASHMLRLSINVVLKQTNITK